MEEIIAENYAEAEGFLEQVPKFTTKNPFEETRAFYGYLQSCCGGSYSEAHLGKVIHVAGTNGKGSVCAFVQQVCIESGYRTGMFTSPHLVDTRERFRIGGSVISEELFTEAFNWLTERLLDYRKIRPGYRPAYFERLFFMGIYVFAQAGVEVTILETGLGGRLDATNVVESPVLTVITEIGLDHMAYLGDTVEAIAAEKAGIIKRGAPVVFSDKKSAASRVICQKAAEYGCKSHAVSEKDYKINEIQKKSIDFSVSSRYYDYGRFTADTTAAYQAENAAVAVRACEILKKDCGFDKIAVESIKEGIRSMRWPGRMEEAAPGVFIDGAHNEDGIAAFARSLEMDKGSGCGGRCILIFSVMRDKQYAHMIETLCGLSMVTDFIITHIPGERGADLAELEQLFRKYTGRNVYTYERIEDAVGFGMANKGSGGVIYIVGSLYLAGITERIFGGDRSLGSAGVMEV